MLILAGQNVSIQGNTVNGNVASGPSPVRGGIVVTRRETTPPANVYVRGNRAFNNAPADLV
jgi:hypothetical protein